jgi:hypothetical protein
LQKLVTLALLLNNKSPPRQNPRKKKQPLAEQERRSTEEQERRRRRQKTKKEEEVERRTKKKKQPLAEQEERTRKKNKNQESSRNFPLFLLPLKTWIVHSADPCDRIPCGKYNKNRHSTVWQPTLLELKKFAGLHSGIQARKRYSKKPHF